jgi:hypothetical protein
VIVNRRTGEGLIYTITVEWLPKILGWNKSNPSGRYDTAMSADALFQVEPVTFGFDPSVIDWRRFGAGLAYWAATTYIVSQHAGDPLKTGWPFIPRS